MVVVAATRAAPQASAAYPSAALRQEPVRRHLPVPVPVPARVHVFAAAVRVPAAA